jgi:hypothetical protein
MLTAAFGDLPSVDVSGQLDVREENVGAPAPCQRLFAIGRMDDNVPFLSQSLHDELAYEGVVLDDEYSHRRLLKFLDRAFLPTADALIAAGKRQNPE